VLLRSPLPVFPDVVKYGERIGLIENTTEPPVVFFYGGNFRYFFNQGRFQLLF